MNKFEIDIDYLIQDFKEVSKRATYMARRVKAMKDKSQLTQHKVKLLTELLQLGDKQIDAAYKAVEDAV